MRARATFGAAGAPRRGIGRTSERRGGGPHKRMNEGANARTHTRSNAPHARTHIKNDTASPKNVGHVTLHGLYTQGATDETQALSPFQPQAGAR